MSTTYKAQALAHELADRLRARGFTALGVVESFDTDQSPLIIIGAGANGGRNAVIKVGPVVWPLAQDILGLTAPQYTPHVLQLVTEANPAGGAGADPLTPADLLGIMGQSVLMGCQTEWYQSASGTAPTAAAIIAGNLKATFAPDVYHAMVSSQ